MTSSLGTGQLRFEPYTPAQLVALIEDVHRFEDLTGFFPADGLREFFVSGEIDASWLASLRQSRDPDPWRFGFAVIHEEARSVIGMASFKGPPDSEGSVEVAYAIAPAFEGRGYATRAARALVDFAFGSASVERVRAHTLPTPNASTRVLAKCGFEHVGDVVDPSDGPVWRWELSRASMGGGK
jgi:ribosomal-protein-alanine N-acetyltransferase